MQPPSLPDAVAPERSRYVDSLGIRLQVHEWGDPRATPILLTHGMFDHSRGFDLLAPRLAEKLRVVAFDARGHGDSDWAESYVWDLDVADVVNVLRSIGEPALLLGHSKGGGQVVDAAIAFPADVLAVVNLDGFGPPPEGFDHPQRTEMLEKTLPERFAAYLDTRRTAATNRAWRARPSFDDLVARRGQQNPRLTGDWLRYFVFHAARKDPEGWRWKVDPHAAGGWGPWRPDWIDDTYSKLKVPLLALIGSVQDNWGPLPEPLLAERLKGVRSLERATVEDAGHFIHMEQPKRTSDLVLDYANRHAARRRSPRRQKQ
jgi:pimeloyl-ACP methyl ester carboxylesterase